MRDIDPPGPDPEALARYIVDTFPGVDVATIVTTDEHDQASNLSRPGVFRLNVGVGRATFERLVGSALEPDYAALDRVLPHPVYAKQLWLSILNPSHSTFESVVKPLLAEAHDRLAAARARHVRGG
jgi:hypothetical protein